MCTLPCVILKLFSRAFLHDSLDPVVQRISAIAGLTTNLNLVQSEQLQLNNYGIGGLYLPHYDFLNDEDGTRDQLVTKELGDRIATFMVYMTDVEAGGATVFPRLNLTLYPEKGAAAFWYNLHRDGTGDVRTLHSGCPVLAGSKWVANKWFREVQQDVTHPCGLHKDSPDKKVEFPEYPYVEYAELWSIVLLKAGKSFIFTPIFTSWFRLTQSKEVFQIKADSYWEDAVWWIVMSKAGKSFIFTPIFTSWFRLTQSKEVFQIKADSYWEDAVWWIVMSKAGKSFIFTPIFTSWFRLTQSKEVFQIKADSYWEDAVWWIVMSKAGKSFIFTPIFTSWFRLTQGSKVFQIKADFRMRSFVCKNRERRVTDVLLIRNIMFENEETFGRGPFFEIEQRKKIQNGFLNRKCHFEIVIWGLIDAVV